MFPQQQNHATKRQNYINKFHKSTYTDTTGRQKQIKGGWCYLFKVQNKNTRTSFDICSELNMVNTLE